MQISQAPAATNGQKLLTNFVTFAVDGTRYAIDTFDIDGIEWREAKRVSGLNQDAIWQGALIQFDLECIGILIWMWRRRDEPGLVLDDVLRSVTFRSVSVVVADEEAEADPPA